MHGAEMCPEWMANDFNSCRSAANDWAFPALRQKLELRVGQLLKMNLTQRSPDIK
jgi:hypothetical protein